MSRHLERLLLLDALLRSDQRQTAQSLAEAVEVGVRTIHSDIAFMRDRFNAPIAWSKSKGYYYSDLDWRLPSISLSKGELFALALGARMLQSYAGSAYAEELKSAIARLAERLPEQSWVDLQQLANERVLFRAGAELNLDPDVWHKLEIACQKHQRVMIAYYTAGRNAHSERVVDPYVLHFSRNNPYVTGYCHLRQEVRWFRVDRIKSLDLLDETFEPHPDFDLKDHFELVFQHEVGGVPTQISIWFDAVTAPYIRERRWHPTQEIDEHPDGSLTLNFVARGLNEVKRWILFYGKGAIALSPPELVKLIRDEVMGLSTHYLRNENNAR
ncbi:helix-turn-helix transcriptional regulator [Leptodesmis sichuanensis]|uniref:helix-turn-helix transcriptional regulator n=1 Tax=Leptodesmis sichuanensis TaxID=2906798 RepID=UPI001F32CF92|nr:WYL domain-containing transcriptional regulator [Leptodesmis sichuanensis]UIE40004.1 WYL domain-containing protein [Leptodesmis sichuanensis A121]